MTTSTEDQVHATAKPLGGEDGRTAFEVVVTAGGKTCRGVVTLAPNRLQGGWTPAGRAAETWMSLALAQDLHGLAVGARLEFKTIADAILAAAVEAAPR